MSMKTKNPPTVVEGFVVSRIICYVRKLGCQRCKKFCKRINRKPDASSSLAKYPITFDSASTFSGSAKLPSCLWA